MTCPRCGAILTWDRICSKCKWPNPEPTPRTQVQYTCDNCHELSDVHGPFNGTLVCARCGRAWKPPVGSVGTLVAVHGDPPYDAQQDYARMLEPDELKVLFQVVMSWPWGGIKRETEGRRGQILGYLFRRGLTGAEIGERFKALPTEAGIEFLAERLSTMIFEWEHDD